MCGKVSEAEVKLLRASSLGFNKKPQRTGSRKAARCSQSSPFLFEASSLHALVLAHQARDRLLSPGGLWGAFFAKWPELLPLRMLLPPLLLFLLLQLLLGFGVSLGFIRATPTSAAAAALSAAASGSRRSPGRSLGGAYYAPLSAGRENPGSASCRAGCGHLQGKRVLKHKTGASAEVVHF